MNTEDLIRFLHALRDDLLDRRMLPAVAAVGVGLIAAFAFVIIGGSSSSSTPAAVPALPVQKGGLPVSEAAAGTKEAVAETTGGTADQRKGKSRDPFEPLPSGLKASLTTTVPAGTPVNAASSASGGGGGGGSAPAAAGATPTTPAKTEPVTPKPTAPRKEKLVIRYAVTAEFGLAASEGAPAHLTPYPALKVNEPLPSQNTQLVYLGVTVKTGKYAVFALTGEAILRGPGKCLPEATHCQAVALTAGQTELLETFDASGHPATYELKVTSIARSITTASGAAVSSPGSKLLESTATLPIDGISPSSQPGVLATAGD